LKEGKSELPLVIVSTIFSALNGTLGPISTIFMAKTLAVLLNPADPEYDTKSKQWSSLFFAVAVAALIFFSLQLWLFSLSGEKFVKKVRSKVFFKFLRMPISWHENPKNAPAVLSTALATDSNNISQLFSNVMGIIS